MTDIAAKGPQSSGRRIDTATRIYAYGSLIVVGGLVAVPLLAAALGGFKSLGELRVNPIGLPRTWLLDNYASILADGRYWTLMWNSLVIAVLTVILTLLVSSAAAFALTNMRFRGRELLLGFFITGLLFPAATAIIPLFVQIRDLGLLDTYWAIVLPQVAFGLAMSILLFRRFFSEIPRELYESAVVDGASYFAIYRYVVLPLSRPILATVAIISFVGSWNNYLLPLIMLNDSAYYPWPLGFMNYMGEYTTDWQLVLAFVTLTILPTIVVFSLAQQHIVAGLTAGAVKG